MVEILWMTFVYLVVSAFFSFLAWWSVRGDPRHELRFHLLNGLAWPVYVVPVTVVFGWLWIYETCSRVRGRLVNGR